MAASTMAASMVQTRVVTRAAAPAQRRTAVVVVRADATEQVSRRAALGAVAGVLGALSLATGGAAEAKTKVAYQESLGRGGSSTAASMSGYSMEGTKKRGISPAERKEFMRKFKEGVSAPPGIADTLKGK